MLVDVGIPRLILRIRLLGRIDGWPTLFHMDQSEGKRSKSEIICGTS
jgi:hypothetical protein